MGKLSAKGGKLLRILEVSRWRRALLRQHVAAAVEHAGVLRAIMDVRTVIDVGANRGQFALVARHIFPAATIVSFEPLKRAAAVWRATFQDDANATLIEAAVGPTSGEATIHISGRDDSSSLLAITDTQEEIFPGTAEVGTDRIRLTRLVEAVCKEDIKAPALLKIDVQGYELQVLEGCEELLGQFAWVYLECSFIELYESQALADEVIAWLRDRGFSLRGIHNLAHDRTAGVSVQADFLFARIAID